MLKQVIYGALGQPILTILDSNGAFENQAFHIYPGQSEKSTEKDSAGLAQLYKLQAHTVQNLLHGNIAGLLQGPTLEVHFQNGVDGVPLVLEIHGGLGQYVESLSSAFVMIV